jgi:hypothetical protein
VRWRGRHRAGLRISAGGGGAEVELGIGGFGGDSSSAR